MITDDDVKRLKKDFATKTDLVVEISNAKDEVKKDLGRVEEKFTTRFDQVMTRLDGVMGELKTMREEQSSHHLQHEDIDRDLAAIKAVPAVAHDLKR